MEGLTPMTDAISHTATPHRQVVPLPVGLGGLGGLADKHPKISPNALARGRVSWVKTHTAKSNES